MKLVESSHRTVEVLPEGANGGVQLIVASIQPHPHTENLHFDKASALALAVAIRESTSSR